MSEAVGRFVAFRPTQHAEEAYHTICRAGVRIGVVMNRLLETMPVDLLLLRTLGEQSYTGEVSGAYLPCDCCERSQLSNIGLVLPGSKTSRGSTFIHFKLTPEASKRLEELLATCARLKTGYWCSLALEIWAASSAREVTCQYQWYHRCRSHSCS